MDAEFYTQILKEALIPFLEEKLVTTGSCRTMIRNIVPDLHANFFDETNINWWHTPPESPDLNPIEKLWHELKEYLRAKVKLHNQAELVEGITKFWSTVTVGKCRKYIGHLRKVITRVKGMQQDIRFIQNFLSLYNHHGINVIELS